ncbi:MAG: phosphoribosylformylglycinamidine cyclo-ligase [Planctomyces sp.]|nr:phosphoribosylformylglycinamidine cyclo-ligase [Planctomyces sp.]
MHGLRDPGRGKSISTGWRKRRQSRRCAARCRAARRGGPVATPSRRPRELSNFPGGSISFGFRQAAAIRARPCGSPPPLPYELSDVSESSLTYRSAGVDLDLYEEAMGRLPALMARTNTPRVMPLPGGFAGLFRLFGEGKKYVDPVLVSGTDGVGTKIKVAALAGKFDTVGIDLVAMCVNDCLCLGAEPLFFLDYLALGRDNPDLIASLVKGVCEGCVEAGAALLGGETAIMPDLYAADDFDLAGFCVGVVERDRILDGKAIRPGDVLIGVDSSGLHSNGFSLVRKIVFEHAGLDVSEPVSELGGTVGDVLLTPTRIYAKTTAALQSRLGERLTGLAHITGGGLAENVARILPEGCRLHIRRDAWTPPPVFDWLRRLGNVDREEMFRVFNMGIGLTATVRADAADAAIESVRACGLESRVIGEVRPGEPGADCED